jgi:two-component system NtrC family sensor kinase
MRTRIGTRVILGAALVTALTIGVMTALVVGAHRSDLIREKTLSANQLSETVKSSAYYDMLENRRDSLQRQIVTIGTRKGIEKVRIFNKEGRIMFSSEAGEIGRTVDTRNEACTACHAIDKPLEQPPIPARSRIFRAAGSGHRVLGIINPIENQASCSAASCHAHAPGERVLGVLDLTVSLAEVDRGISEGRSRMIVLALLAIAAMSGILWWLSRVLVVLPVQRLAAGTRRVAEGDLTTRIPAEGDHELGDLARAFNEMTQRLSEAQRQLAQADKLASVGRLAAGVAHEINNPLTGVLTYASFLLKRSEEKSETKADLEVIVRETKRCREIVKGLLDFARQTPPKRQPTDLNDVARRAVTMVMNRLKLDRVALSLDLAPELPEVEADPNQMQQVLVNLLVNAADAIGSEGGAIRLSSYKALLPPRGYAPIRKAVCPAGCDLVDPTVRIGGLPALRVIRLASGKESVVHLDPVYGRFNHSANQACDEGIVAEMLCSRCRAPLAVAGERCGECGAGRFGVQVPGGGQVLWCARVGCHSSTWKEMEEQGERPVVELEVEDNGRGIEPRDLPHLFEPFFSTKGTRGTGLGLAVSWGIVEGHGGTLEVHSEVGKGSRFTVRLPLEPQGKSPQGKSPAAGDASRAVPVGAGNGGAMGRPGGG